MSAWEELSGAFSRSNSDSANELLEVLKLILALQVEVQSTLSAVQEDVDAIKRGPFFSGIHKIEEATEPYRTEQERIEAIRQAKEYFIQAHSNEINHPLERAIVETHIGLCWLMLGSRPDGKKYILMAMQSVPQFTAQLVHAMSQTSKLQRLTRHAWKAMIPAAFIFPLTALGGLTVNAVADYVVNRQKALLDTTIEEKVKKVDPLFKFLGDMIAHL